MSLHTLPNLGTPLPKSRERVKSVIRLVADQNVRKAQFESIAVVGLGYVGLPLAVKLGDKFASVTGFDISKKRIFDLKSGFDATGEIETTELLRSGINATTDLSDITDASFYIVTVPTPINDVRQPDLSPLQSACEAIGLVLEKGNIVVFESTVYPGVTEEFCAPILEKLSGLTSGRDFGLGYSPERINPGDDTNTIDKVVKVVSGDSDETLARVQAVYGLVVEAGIYSAESIQVAEAAKVLENTQRDINIALMNEMSLICDKIGISTRDVIDAAATKWNFVPYMPGLVGGHCIGVDPYYLAALSEKVGHHPQLILAGRRTNDSMVEHVGNSALRLMVEQGTPVRDMRVAVCGVTFKEDVPDIRNSKALELIKHLRSYSVEPLIHDPHCDADEAAALGFDLCDTNELFDLDMMIMVTPHEEYVRDEGYLTRIKPKGMLLDVKGVYRNSQYANSLTYWSL